MVCSKFIFQLFTSTIKKFHLFLQAQDLEDMKDVLERLFLIPARQT